MRDKAKTSLAGSALAVLATLLASAALAAPALATPSFDFAFGTQGTLGGQFPESQPSFVAVSESGAGGVPAGTVYATNGNQGSGVTGAHLRIESFAPDGSFLRAWGQDVVQSGKPEDTGSGFEICEVAANCKVGVESEGPGGFYVFSERSMGGIAVDQSSGDVYVFDSGNYRVEAFDATGHFLRAWGDDVASAGPGNTGANPQQKLTVKAAKGAFSLSLATAKGFGVRTEGSNVVSGVETTLGAFHVGDTVQGLGFNGFEGPPTITALGPGTITLSKSVPPNASGLGIISAEEDTGATGSGNLTEGSTEVSGLATYSGAFAAGQTLGSEAAGVLAAQTTIVSCSPSCGPAATSLTLSKAAKETATAENLFGNNVPYNATAAQLGAALEALPGVGSGDVTASGGPGDSKAEHPYTVSFSAGRLAGNFLEPMEASSTGLGGVAGPGATVQTLVGGGGPEICEPAAGDTCKGGVAGALGGEFAAAGGSGSAGVGVDAGGDVYLGDAGNARVQKFDSTGHFLAAGGWDVDAANPSTEYETCTAAANCKAGASGSGAGQFSSEGIYLAVAPAGDVYASNRPASKVYHLTPALGFDPSFAPAAPFGGTLPVATGDGDVFAPSGAGERLLFELEPSGALAQAIALERPAEGALAFDSAAERLYTENHAGIAVYAEGPTLPAAAPSPASAIGPNGATLNGHAYPNGLELADCAFEYLPQAEYNAHGQSFAGASTAPCEAPDTAEIGTPIGPVAVHAEVALAPNTQYAYRLALENANGRVASTNGALATPVTITAETEPPSGLGQEAATLEGSVDPFGHAVAECAFEWGETAAYGHSAPCEAPSAGEIPVDSSPHAVYAELSGLHVGTEYHYRLRAANAEATVFGQDASFTTLGPRIAASWSEGVSEAEGTLKAQIDPEGLATSYRFEYDTAPYSQGQAPHGTSVPLPAGELAPDSSLHTLGAALEGLSPATTYHYRVVAESECEAAVRCLNEGPDRSFTTYAPAAASDSCPNAAFRTGPGASLPDCRAYEMVSPVDKGGGDIAAAERPGAGTTAFDQAAIEGGRITYTSSTAFGDAKRGAYANQYLATRGPGGWSTEAIDPPQGTTVFDPNYEDAVDLQNAFQAFTPDLCRALMVDQNLTPLTADAIHGYTDLYWRQNCGGEAGSYEALTRGEAPSSSGYGKSLNIQARNHAAGGCATVMAAEAALTPEAAPGSENNAQIYELSCAGARRLVSRLPNGEASTTYSRVGTGGDPPHDATSASAVSSDASRVFWTASGDSAGALYLRLNAAAPETSAKDGEGDCVPDPALACTVAIATGARFWAADEEGKQAIYSAGGNLYEYDVAAETRTKIAGEADGVAGASADLSRVYFTAEEAIAGSGANEHGAEAVAGLPNLYLREGGEERFVATLAQEDSAHGNGHTIARLDNPSPEQRASRVSANGASLAFTSASAALARSVAGYDNSDRVTGAPDAEVYLYDAASGRLVCASCNPTGGRPLGANIANKENPRYAAAYIPGWQWSNNASRALSGDGSRLFFNAYDSLAPADTNGQLDVYEWEAPGSGPAAGRCAESSPTYTSRDGGCLSLISTGKSPAPSNFVDASAGAGDVFLSTQSSIAPQDPGLIDIYDAREEGGYPAPAAGPDCAGDACQSVPPAPAALTPASAVFEGAGNVHEGGAKKKARKCARGKVKRQRRCVKRKAHRKHRAKRHHHHRARRQRRAGR